ncbi:MAG TPA: hypothetical protein VNU71_09985 [Burkholderiaceae bacterium]|nr:hypothetical protein [Burkholderiaceae bacterium]
MSARFGFRLAAGALLGGAYVLLCHWLMTRAQASAWNVVGVLGPMLGVIALGAWRAGQRWLGAGAALLLALLCGQALLGVPVAPQRLYLAQHAGMNLFLAVVFGSTLRAGHAPLITALARRVHRQFTPAMALYTRHCTLAWTLYFVAVAGVSLVLFALASFDAWALFANLLSPLSVGVMFGAEYLLRYWLHPEFERTSIADAVRSYLHGAPEPPAARHGPAR